MHHTPEDLLIAPPLRIRYMRGNGARLVVSFSGVGNARHEEPPLEFFRLAHGLTGTGAAGTHDTLFVTDESRSWMNAEGMADAVAATVQRTAQRIGAARVVALGNSMGGSAAMILASLIRVDAVVAIAPQFSVHPDLVPDETRWRYFRDRIAQWPHAQVPDLAGRDGEVTVLHGSTTDELAHATRFPEMEAHFVIPGQDHRLARSLHSRGQLQPIVSNAIIGRPTRARTAIRAAGGLRRAQYLRQNTPRFTEETAS